MSTRIIILIATIFIFLILYIFSLRTRLFDKYFELHLEESYDLVDLFPIKFTGNIYPKVDYLDIPYNELSIEITTKTIKGSINNNIVTLELIKLNDRKKALYLVKKYYIILVRSYISETIKNKKQYIELINLSKKEKQHIEKVACTTCKHKMQCKISHNSCNYEKVNTDVLLSKGLRINNNKDYELN